MSDFDVCRLPSCVRPFDAVDITAGLDEVDDLISRDYARDVFGVIFQDGIVDKDATVAKRKALQTCRTHLTTYVDLFHSEVGIASSDWNAHEAKAGPL